MCADDQKLRAAIAWIGDRYPQLLPRSVREVAIQDGATHGADADTRRLDGRISIKPGQSLVELKAILAHELMHSHPESMIARLREEQALDPEEHTFISQAEAAVRWHAAREEEAGRPLDSEALFLNQQMHERLAFAQDGTPELWVRRVADDKPVYSVIVLPESSTARESFER